MAEVKVKVRKRFSRDGKRISYTWTCPHCNEFVEFNHWNDTMRCDWCNKVYQVELEKL